MTVRQAHQSLNFGDVSNFFLLGGGQCLFDAVKFLLEKGQRVVVLTSKRHHQACIACEGEQRTLSDALSELGVTPELADKVDAASSFFASADQRSMVITPSAEWIFSKSIIESFHGRVVNIHGSRLPELKGGGGLSWNFLMGMREGGSTIHMVDPGIDTGDILLQDAYEFPASVRTLAEANEFVQGRNSRLMISFLGKVLSGEAFERRSQPVDDGSYWPRLKTDIHGYINWRWSAQEISAFVEAFGAPFAGASTFLGEKRVRVLRARSTSHEGNFHPFQYGIIFRVLSDTLFVASRDGVLVVERLVDHEGNVIDSGKLLGRRLYTPDTYLEEAMSKRVVFSVVSASDPHRINLL